MFQCDYNGLNLSDPHVTLLNHNHKTGERINKLYHLSAPKCIFLQTVILRNVLNNSEEYSDAVRPVTSLLLNTATGHISKSHKETH